MDCQSALKKQEDTLRDYCNKHNYNVVEVVCDVCSGSKVGPELMKLLSAHDHNATTRDIDLVLATENSRFSRNPIALGLVFGSLSLERIRLKTIDDE